MWSVAIRAASMTMSKHSEGVAGASTGRGASPWRPYRARLRSACSGLVGIPVEGPARCTSIASSGSSAATARLSVSDFRAMPGPELVVTPSPPAYEAPSAAVAAAISSSAWNVTMPWPLREARKCNSAEAGVIG